MPWYSRSDPLRVSQGRVARSFREAIAPHLGDYHSDNPMSIIREVRISERGHFVDRVRVSVQRLSQARLDSFKWLIPIVTPETRAVGLDIAADPRIRRSTLLIADDSYVVSIEFEPLAKEEAIELDFSIFMVGMTESLRPLWLLRPFVRRLSFPFAFIPAAAVESYELRVQLPRVLRYKADSGLSFLEEVDLGETTTLVGRLAKPAMAAVDGHVDVLVRRRSFDSLVAAIAGIAATSGVAIAQSEIPPEVFVAAIGAVVGGIVWILLLAMRH